MCNRGWLLALLTLVAPSPLVAQAIQTGFLDRVVTVDGVQRRYQVYVPRSYTSQPEWPVVLSLHGAGPAWGEDGIRPTEGGLGEAIRSAAEKWPVIAVFPQVPRDVSWLGPGGRVALAALDATLDEFRSDLSRIYLTGTSMGGHGVWALAYEYPDRFAALVPVVGSPLDLGFGVAAAVPGSSDVYGDLTGRLLGVPTWFFHGDADQVVPVAESRELVAAFTAAGANVTYTEFPDVGHGAADRAAYTHEGLPAWLLAQRKR